MGWDRSVRMLRFVRSFVLLLCSSSSSPCGYAFAPSMIVSKSTAGDTVSKQTGLARGPTESRTTATPSSVYVNLPFCRRRCFYCDFPIKVVGDRPGAAAAAAEPYVGTLLREIRTTAACLGARRDVVKDGVGVNAGWRGGCGGRGGTSERMRGGVSTLFFGGGTPSLCPPELVGSIVETVRDCFGIADGAEISIEMDPGTFDEERLGAFLAQGVTRVSIGVQSFDAGLLQACGRAHSLEDVYEAVELLRRSGVQNFSIDLMSGLPGQTLEQWEHTLSEAVSTGAAHISVYDLQVEARTAFGRWFTPGESPLPQDEICAEMYRRASALLGGAGYSHYEISNYARPGFESRHNRAYWENVPFFAFGNGAASYVDGRRFSRPRGLSDYDRWVDRELVARGWEEATVDADAGRDAGLSREAAAERDALYDDIMLGFRLREGLDLDDVASKHGDRAAVAVEDGSAEGLRLGWVLRDGIEEAHHGVSSAGAAGSVSSGFGGARHQARSAREGRQRGRLRLSDPEGFLFSNSVISSVFCELDKEKAS